MVYDENGQLLTGSFMDYDMPKIDTVPTLETILVQNPSPHGPFGARGIGEPPITAGAAALANAVRDATGVRVTETPISTGACSGGRCNNGRLGTGTGVANRPGSKPGLSAFLCGCLKSTCSCKPGSALR